MLEDLRANVRRTAFALLVCFGVVALALGYWQVWRASDLLGISQRDRIDLKHAVADRAGGQVKDDAVGG